jgi:hypothetical protein
VIFDLDVRPTIAPCERPSPSDDRPSQRKARVDHEVGQALGAKAHAIGVPWDARSGERLRTFMEIDAETFYDRDRVAILPMCFYFPGRATSGDMPPRRECAELWLDHLLAKLPRIELTLLSASTRRPTSCAIAAMRLSQRRPRTRAHMLPACFHCRIRDLATSRGSRRIHGSTMTCCLCCGAV